MRVGIIGCGLIGSKRAEALDGAKLVATSDVVPEKAQALARKFDHAVAYADWHELIEKDDIDAVIVATTNDSLAGITLAAIEHGKHVLVEKPAARNASELRPVVDAAARNHVQVRVGFNHRYHPAVLKARQLIEDGNVGPLMFIRGRYGHGGRVGYEKEWRADPIKAGGGELLDQGVHLIDLARLFLGNFPEVTGFSHTYFWDMPVEDNGFMLLKTAEEQTAFLHVSCTEWKNLFSFEIYGHHAKLHIEGLGGSYGLERLAYYQMSPQMGPPDTTIWEYPQPDHSWRLEFQEFMDDVSLDRVPAANLNDALAALEVVERIYELSK